jgi:XTP/dITP diphosphohydrolase
VTRILLATRSAGKLRELRPLLAACGFEAIDLVQAGLPQAPDEEAIECHQTFESNALAKARYFHALSGLAVVADDSGLMVDALGGRPGVRSKRWSGRHELRAQALDDANNAALQAALVGITDRRARYACAAAYVDDATEIVTRGETEGVILEVACGTGGFGYDPFFLSGDLGRTFAEVEANAKERVSHRGRAFRALIAALSSRR